MMFDGKVVWITGGGSGIGKELAFAFARQGASVAVSGRRVERLTDVVATIEAAGGRALAVACDVTDEEQLCAAVADIVEAFGALDVAVANAGFSVAGKLEKISADDWRRQFDVNVVGAASTARVALPELKKSRGRVVFIASVSGLLCTPGMSAYSSSKFALRAIGLTLSQELSGTGVSCTTIHPGFIESEIAKVDNQGVYHEDRGDPRPAQLMWSAEDAAKVMVKAIHKRKREYVLTWHGKFGAFLGQHAPSLVHFVMTRASSKKKSASSSG